MIGGIRLQVAEEDAEAAETVLTQPIPGSIAVAGEPDYEQPQCPRCNSLDISYEGLTNKVGATSILLLGFPLPSPLERDYWHCHDCGANWVEEPEYPSSVTTDGNA
jgi:transposase-like protein